MSTNPRLERLLRLVNLLQSGRQFNTRELSERLNVSRRTIFRDINLLQESGMQVQFSEEKQGYSLPDPVYVQPLDLSLDEVLFLLILCGNASEETQQLPFPEAAQSASLKILSSLPQSMRESVGELTEHVQFRWDHQSSHGPHREHYENCLRALQEKKQLRIHYLNSPEYEETEFTISPYRVVFLRRAWYVVARSHTHQEIRIFKLSRIQSSELLTESYHIPRHFQLNHFLGNAWHLVRDPSGQSWDVEIRFASAVAHNVAEVGWHKTQKIHWNDDGSLLFQVTVDSLKEEIVWWVLGYGDQAEVIKPTELRDEVVHHARKMLQSYSSKEEQ